MTAALGTGALTLVDIAKGWDPDGSLAKVVELLDTSNQILQDEPWMQGNLPNGHRFTSRTGLPSVSWRLLNNGVTPTKSTKAQAQESTGLMEAWSEVDVKVAEMNGNVAAERLSEATAFIQSMNQEQASVLWYGNSGVNPEKYTGFSPRYANLATGTNLQNIIDGGGTGTDNMSVWLIGWGENSVSGIYPKGSTAGLQHNDFGAQTILSASAGGIGTGRMRVYQEQFIWECGLLVKDWRYAVRVANIDVSNLVADTAAADLSKLMIKAMARLGVNGNGQDTSRAVWYMNRTAFEMLAIQRRNDVRTGGQLNYDVVDGKFIPNFMGLPVRRSDALLNTESRVV